jgi:hypothetical protein
MKKYKTKLVKFVFTPKLYIGDDWYKPPNPDYHFGNRYTEELNTYQYNRNHISVLFSDELSDDPRQYNRKAKYTINEAHIILLQYLEDRLKSARAEKRRLDRLTTNSKNYPRNPITNEYMSSGLEYALTLNNRELAHTLEAVKKYRKIVKEIKASKEYMWETLNK